MKRANPNRTFTPRDQEIIDHINHCLAVHGKHSRTSCPPNSRAMCKYAEHLEHMNLAGTINRPKVPKPKWMVGPGNPQ